MSGIAQKLHLRKSKEYQGAPLAGQQQGAVPVTAAPLNAAVYPVAPGASTHGTFQPLAGQPGYNAGLVQPQGAGFNQGLAGQQQFGQQQQFVGQPGYIQPGMAPTQTQTVMMPAIVQETIRTDRIVEVQPVIHREIDQTTINHIEQHVTQAPAPNMGGVVQMAPIVQETVRPQVIDEITPVIHRQVATTQVERIEEHIGERVVAPTQHTNQVVYENQAGLVGQQGLGLNQGLNQQQGLGLNHGLNQQQGLGLNQGLNQQQGLGLNQGLNQQQGLGLNQGGLNQGGLNQGGLNQGGLNQGGLNQGGLNQGGLNQGGLNQGGFNQNQGLNQGQQGGFVANEERKVANALENNLANKNQQAGGQPLSGGAATGRPL